MKKSKGIITLFEGKEKGIAVDPDIFRDDFNKISKINYPNFRFIGNKTVINTDNNEKKDVWFIKIFNVPENMIIEIKNTINNYVDDEDLSFSEAINKIIDLFRKVKLSNSLKEELLGDLGEAIFIYKNLVQYNFNLLPFMRKEDNNIYDFNCNGLNIEIKSSSKEKNDFNLTNEQLEQIKEKEIVIVKYKKIEGYQTILDIYEKIRELVPLNQLLLEKQSKWKYFSDIAIENNESDILKNYSVIIDNCKIYKFNKKKLPSITINQMNACKKISFNINCTDSELLDYSEILNIIKTK